MTAKNPQENLATLTVCSLTRQDDIHARTHCPWIRADICRQDGAICSKNSEIVPYQRRISRLTVAVPDYGSCSCSWSSLWPDKKFHTLFTVWPFNTYPVSDLPYSSNRLLRHFEGHLLMVLSIMIIKKLFLKKIVSLLSLGCKTMPCLWPMWPKSITYKTIREYTNSSDKHIELTHFDYDLTFRMYSTYLFKSNRWNLKQLFIYIYYKGEGTGT